MNENMMNAKLDLSSYEEGKAALIAAVTNTVPDPAKPMVPMIVGQFITLALMN